MFIKVKFIYFLMKRALFLIVLLILLVACTSKPVQIANPASEFCVKQNGTSQIVTAADGSQSGVCTLKDGTKCDEWAYFRGECPSK
jgi:putative hemolysin